eukprot:368961-Pelagomonas_calceolata.AAC.3
MECEKLFCSACEQATSSIILFSAPLFSLRSAICLDIPGHLRCPASMALTRNLIKRGMCTLHSDAVMHSFYARGLLSGSRRLRDECSA